MSTSIDEDLADIFQAHADPDRAESMSAYMKNQFHYYGISSPLSANLYVKIILKLMNIPLR